jgi:phytoene dehydrogenase-like protein
MGTEFDVIVVGGGLAGLAAGATAAAGGASTVVVEAHRAGGRARTTERDGFVFNQEIHALFAGGPGMVVLERLGVRPQGAAPPMDRYVLVADGEQHRLPIGPDGLAATSYLDAADKAQVAKLGARMADVDPARLQRLAVSDWLATQDLRPRVDALTRALFRLSTYAADLDRFGADAAIAQQQIAARAGVLYLDDGWAQLVAQLGAHVEVRGGIGVRSVEGDATGAVAHTDDGPVTAGAVVVAVGTPAAARAILPVDPGWGSLGDPVTAACLDAGVRGVPLLGYVVSLDDPLYGTIQSPPARQAPPGRAVPV